MKFLHVVLGLKNTIQTPVRTTAKTVGNVCFKYESLMQISLKCHLKDSHA